MLTYSVADVHAFGQVAPAAAGIIHLGKNPVNSTMEVISLVLILYSGATSCFVTVSCFTFSCVGGAAFHDSKAP